MKKGFLLFCALFLTAGTLVWAGESSNWGGFYVGASAGLGRHEPNWSDNDYDWFGGTLTNPYGTLLPGITLGFNYQYGNLVIGFEADGAIGFKENEILYDLRGTAPTHWVTKTDKLGLLITARGRMGFIIEKAMFYLTAGVGMPSASHSWIEFHDEPDSWEKFNISKLGIVVGIGVEHRIGKAFSIKIEYICFQNPPTAQPNEYDPPYYMSIDETIKVLRLGFNFTF